MSILFRWTPGVLAAMLMLCLLVSKVWADEEGTINGKCLTPYVNFARLHPLKNAELQKRALSGRPSNEVSMLSTSGFFRIHYDTSAFSSNLPAMVDADGNRIALSAGRFVDTVAKIFDSVWRAEITTFNFPPPPSDNGDGGGNEYDVYIQDLGPNYFGYTQAESSRVDPPTRPNPRCPSYIVIDNDYGTGFRTKGVPGVSVTAAHEFFHAIQMGGYGFWDEAEFYFYEMSAESMEPKVFPTVKDYVKDIFLYYNNPDLYPLYDSDRDHSYGRAIWGIYLVQRYGIQIMKSIWEEISSQRCMPAMDKALVAQNISLQQAFATFAQWNFYTGGRADTVHYFRDGNIFPTLSIIQTQNITSNAYMFQRIAKSYSMQFLRVTRGFDTVFCIVANVNTPDAVGSVHASFPYALSVSPRAVEGWSNLPSQFSYKFVVDDQANWSSVFAQSAGVLSSNEMAPFPNPFNPRRSSILFPMPPGQIPSATLYVLSASMELVAEVNPGVVTEFGRTGYQWDGRNAKGEFVSSGIYLYVIRGDGIEIKGKFAVVQ